MSKIAVDRGWRPIEEAPKDGTWIIGFRNGCTDPVYVAMRWWDGIMPEEDDDLSCEEEGSWVGPEDRTIRGVTDWLPFIPHTNAPPPTTSIDDDDALRGIRHLSRAERGVTQAEIDEARACHAEMEALQEPESSYDAFEESAHNDNSSPLGAA